MVLSLCDQPSAKKYDRPSLGASWLSPSCELAVCVCLQANPVWNLLKKDAQKLNVNVSHRQPHCDLETSQKITTKRYKDTSDLTRSKP